METEGDKNNPDISGFNKNLNKPFSDQEEDLIRSWWANHPATDPDLLADEARLNAIGAAMLGKIEERTRHSEPVRRLTSLKWIAAASVALLIVGISWFRISSNPENNLISYHNSTNEIQKIRLEDGTTVWLNKNTTIKYPEKFAKDKRTFTLSQGEAFFDVKRDPRRPFQIQAPDFNVSVLGTSFNIKVLDNIPIARVTVASGQVKVKNEHGESDILVQNDELEINKQNGRFSMRQIAASDANAWRSGQIFLEDVPFQELVRTLEQTYNVNVSYPEGILNKQNASLKFDSGQTLASVLEIIAQVYNLNYRQKGKEVTLEINTTTR